MSGRETLEAVVLVVVWETALVSLWNAACLQGELGREGDGPRPLHRDSARPEGNPLFLQKACLCPRFTLAHAASQGWQPWHPSPRRSGDQRCKCRLAPLNAPPRDLVTGRRWRQCQRNNGHRDTMSRFCGNATADGIVWSSGAGPDG